MQEQREHIAEKTAKIPFVLDLLGASSLHSQPSSAAKREKQSLQDPSRPGTMPISVSNPDKEALLRQCIQEYLGGKTQKEQIQKTLQRLITGEMPSAEAQDANQVHYIEQVAHMLLKLVRLTAARGSKNERVTTFEVKYRDHFPWAARLFASAIRMADEHWKGTIKSQQLKQETKKPAKKKKKNPSTSTPVSDRSTRPSEAATQSTTSILSPVPQMTSEGTKQSAFVPSTTGALHPCDVRGLKAKHSVQIFIDESGSIFDETSKSAAPPSAGRVAAVVMVDDHDKVLGLPKNWHSVKESKSDIDAAIQELIDQRCGVFGITCATLGAVPGQLWVDSVLNVIGWILRLLPLENQVSIKVNIENRAEFYAGQSWALAERQCLIDLKKTTPEKAARIKKLTIAVIGKEDSRHLGYADAVAYTWSESTPSSKARLERSKLVDHCLHNIDSEVHHFAWDQISQGKQMDLVTWWRLIELTQPDDSITKFILEELGREVRADAELWKRFLQAVIDRTNSDSYSIKLLCNAIDWLKKFAPEMSSLPPLQELIWLTIQLTKANHLGHPQIAAQGRLKELTESLMAENAPLVASAHLNLAVSYTNRLEFQNAIDTLRPLSELDLRILGLQNWGKIQSSLGQHAAFQGKWKEAAQRFESALAAFAELSDPQAREAERRKTATYLAIALMDDPEIGDERAREAVEAVAGPLLQAIAQCSSEERDDYRYIHHLLLRFLIHRPDSHGIERYLAQAEKWDSSFGHPWPLIELYRAMLIRNVDPQGARIRANRAVDLTKKGNQGPIVHWIGLVIHAIAATWDQNLPPYDVKCEEIQSQIPAVEPLLHAFRTLDPAQPLPFLRATLPFHMH